MRPVSLAGDVEDWRNLLGGTALWSAYSPLELPDKKFLGGCLTRRKAKLDSGCLKSRVYLRVLRLPLHRYAGKVIQGSTQPSELLTESAEELASDAAGFARDYPELFDLLVGVLRAAEP